MTRWNHAATRFLLPVAAFGVLCATGCAQTTKDPSKFDIDGVRLGMSLDEVEAALRSHASTPHVERIQYQSNLGKGTYIGALIAMSSADPNKWAILYSERKLGDNVAVMFTETVGHKAFMINRRIQLDDPTPLDLLEKQAIEKYGNRPPPMYPLDSDAYWAFDPTGKPLPEGPPSHPNPLWGECTFKGLVVGTGGGGLDQVLHFYDATVVQLFSTKTIRYEASAPLRNEFWANCGVTLQNHYVVSSTKGRGWVDELGQSLIDNQLQTKNLTNIKNLNKVAAAQRDEQLRKNAEKQKSPFDK